MEIVTESRWPIWEDTRWYRAVAAEGLSQEQRIVLEHLLTMGNRTKAARASGLPHSAVRELMDHNANFRTALAAARKAMLAARARGETVDCADSVFDLLRIA